MSTVNNLTTYLIEDRKSAISPFGKGNSKLGNGIYTYSRLPGRILGTCPGSSWECEQICFAKRVINNAAVWKLWQDNTMIEEAPQILPIDAKIVRIHVSGDFDTVKYIRSWQKLALSYPNVLFFGYTRSWRVKELLPYLTKLGEINNVTLWASMDHSIEEMPPATWRRAWIEGDDRIIKVSDKMYKTYDGRKAIICPEENGLIPNCETCGYCFQYKDRKSDLVFLKH